MKPATAPKSLKVRIRWPLRLTWLGLVSERFLRAFWPAYSLTFALVSLAWFGLHEAFPFFVTVSLLAALLIALIALTWHGASRFHFPTGAETLARLDETLSGQPLATLSDSQTVGIDDPASRAVWKAHLAQMAEKTQGAQAPWPNLRLADRDPNGLRLMAVVALLVALIFGSPKNIQTVPILADNLASGSLVAGPQWEGWIQPPSYTGKPNLYLNDLMDRAEITVPEGSVISLRFYDAKSVGSLTQTLGSLVSEAQVEGMATLVTIPVEQSGNLTITGTHGSEWDVTMLEDESPEIVLTAPVETTLDGELKQEFHALDDYGVAAGTIQFSLDFLAIERRHGLKVEPDPREDIVLDLPLPYSRDATSFTEIALEDFSAHVWAGLPVTMRVQVVDDLDQLSEPDELEIKLPKRKFFNPLAASVVEARRDILWARSNGPRAEEILRAVSHRPEDLDIDESGFLMLRVAMQRLKMANLDGLNDEEQEMISDALWEIALRLEEGGLDDAKARLERAEQRLAEAMERGAGDEEIAELMDELRQAMDDYMNQLAQNAEPNPDQQSAENQESRNVTQDEIDALLDQIQELMEQGRMAEAQQLLEMLREMMENLQVTQGDGQGDGPQTPGERSMEGLQETLRDQRDLSDEAFRELQERYNPSSPQGQDPSAQPNPDGNEGDGPSGNEQTGEGGGDGDQESDQGQPGGSGSLADRQEALREDLRRQSRNLPSGLDGGAGEALDRAGRAMEEAEDALEGDDIPLALDRQSEAIEAMREGMRELGQAMAESEGSSGDEGQTAQGDGQSGGDPLGRTPGTLGATGSEGPLADGENAYGRARELLDELRRREGDKSRPDQELEYLRRLMDQF